MVLVQPAARRVRAAGHIRSWSSVDRLVLVLVLGLLGALALPALLALYRSTATSRLAITQAEPRDADVLGYVASYLVPFASTQLQAPRERLAIGLFVAMIGILYVRGELFYINPLLALVGIRIFKATTLAETPGSNSSFTSAARSTLKSHQCPGLQWVLARPVPLRRPR